MNNPIKKLLSRKPPDVIYHYTTHDGLNGILKDPYISTDKVKSVTLWASKIQFLNDILELNMAIKLAEKLLKDIHKKSKKTLKAKIDDALDELTKIFNIHVFISSFSKEGDLLSQWRAYSNFGKGYSIGFSTKEIKNQLFGNLRFQCFLAPVTYNKDEHKQIILQIIKDTVLKPGKANFSNDIYNPEIMNFQESFLLLAPLLKHESFKEEAEWRLISPVKAVGIQFRVGNATLIPYIHFNFEKSVVCKIITGPSPEPELKKSAIETLLRYRDFKCKVQKSEIPFRNW